MGWAAQCFPVGQKGLPVPPSRAEGLKVLPSKGRGGSQCFPVGLRGLPVTPSRAEGAPSNENG